MELGIIKNLKNYFLFLKNMDSEYVVRTEIEQFCSLSLSIIFDGEIVEKTHPFFHRSTIQQKINFKDFLENDDLRIKIQKIENVKDVLTSESELFKQKTVEMISSDQKHNTILENKMRGLLNEMFIRRFRTNEFSINHQYIESRISEENKANLIMLYTDFLKMIDRESSRLYELLG
jgi:hypothetical protein